MHEFTYWEPHVQFITLTYDNEHLPPYYSLRYTDFQKFMKRLRKGLKDERIKYLVSGEYGSRTHRPHYHAIIFGITSEKAQEVEDIWGLGKVDVGYSVTPQTCQYVAQYTLKKVYGENAKEYYKHREVPFLRCSNGLGKRYAQDNEWEVFTSTFLKKGRFKVKVPRYYHKIVGMQRDLLYREFIWEKNQKLLDEILEEVPNAILQIDAGTLKSMVHSSALQDGSYLEIGAQKYAYLSEEGLKYMKSMAKQTNMNIKSRQRGKREGV